MTSKQPNRERGRVPSQPSPLTPESSVAILKEARHSLRLTTTWTTKAYARTSYDKRVNPTDPNAVRLSLMGAVHRAKHTLGFNPNAHDDCRNWLRIAIDRYCKSAVQPTPTSIEDFNDSRRRNHSEVLRVLDLAIGIGEGLIEK